MKIISNVTLFIKKATNDYDCIVTYNVSNESGTASKSVSFETTIATNEKLNDVWDSVRATINSREGIA